MVADVLASTLGLVVLGVEHDAATMNADASPLTFGIDDPTTATARLAAAGIPGGSNDVIVAAFQEEKRGISYRL